MAFVAPEGTVLVAPIGAGSVFDVALVREGDAALVCKRLVPRLLREPAGRAAMVREAKALALARHASLPTLVRVGNDGRGPFLLETRADGVSARELVDGWQLRGGTVPPLLVRHVARAAIGALAELQELEHDAAPLGLVHGDIGPDHVLLGPLGQVRFVDFGAARWRGMDASLTTDDRGTLPFVAPEVARGEVAPGPAHDVYALAATLVFLARGRPLLPVHDQAALLLAIGERGIPADVVTEATALTPGERSALAAALAHDPARRIASARALLEALDA